MEGYRAQETLAEVVRRPPTWIAFAGKLYYRTDSQQPGPADLEVVPVGQLRGAVEAERRRSAALVRCLAEGSWDPAAEAALREAARQIIASGGGGHD